MLKVVFTLAFCIALAFGNTVRAQGNEDYADDLRRLVQDIRDLQRYVYSGSGSGQPAKPGRAQPSNALPADAVSRLHLKLQSLETQIMTLTGKVEEIENSQDRDEDRLQRLISDVDLRLRAIEIKTGVSQSFQGPKPSVGSDKVISPASGLRPGQKILGTVSPGDIANNSTEIKQRPGLSGLGHTEHKQPKNQSSSGVQRPLDAPTPKSPNNVGLLPDGTPNQQYTYAFGLLKNRDFKNAARSLNAFIKKNPKHALAGNAMYWLGETYYDQKQYAEAARVFLDGYRRYPKSKKAPDNLLKLGKALNSVGEKKSACATWLKLLKDYPNAGSRLTRNAKNAVKRNKCN
ncbi:MAG: tol-pal system protein YbgF [Rhodospirillaceae bacterium]|nr:tol-pal system protein YbgF [Rhodospirillaceae bacterium]|tara:strand:+ start:2448 stop:3485 length:1038 start_codon:yes stop_codon:yes gene_type:complete